MRPAKINYYGDPFNSDAVSEFIQVKSAGYSGSDVDLVCPASGNFPPVSLNRYFLYLPYVPDLTDLGGTRPMLIKDVTGGVVLSRVSAAPGVNEYRVAAADSKTPHVIELNGGQAGHTIAYSFYSIGSVANAEDFNDPDFNGDVDIGDDLAVTDDVTIGGTLGVTGILSAATQINCDALQVGSGNSLASQGLAIGQYGDALADSLSISPTVNSNWPGACQQRIQNKTNTVLSGGTVTFSYDVKASYAYMIKVKVLANDYSHPANAGYIEEIIGCLVSAGGAVSLIGTASTIKAAGGTLSIAYDVATSLTFKIVVTNSIGYAAAVIISTDMLMLYTI